MYIREINGFKLLSFERFSNEDIECIVTTRYRQVLPNSAPLVFDASPLSYKTSELFTSAFRPLICALNIDRLAYMHQTHSANIAIADRGFGIYENTDGLITNKAGLGLLAVSADCALTCFYDKRHKAIAIMHSGWRGAFLNIYASALNAMRLNYATSPLDIIACAAPMISARNYEVRSDFINCLKRFYPLSFKNFLHFHNNKVYFDLRALLASQLKALGIKDFTFAAECTFSNPHLFPSYRRDPLSKCSRFGLIAAIKA